MGFLVVPRTAATSPPGGTEEAGLSGRHATETALVCPPVSPPWNVEESLLGNTIVINLAVITGGD